jgi:hypothetical protein
MVGVDTRNSSATAETLVRTVLDILERRGRTVRRGSDYPPGHVIQKAGAAEVDGAYVRAQAREIFIGAWTSRGPAKIYASGVTRDESTGTWVATQPDVRSAVEVLTERLESIISGCSEELSHAS